MANPSCHRELAAWIHPVSSQSHDGIPGCACSVNEFLDFATPIFALVMRTFDMGSSIANRNHQLITKSPAILVLGTRDPPTH